ncbi:MAG: alpha/beta fold hydrolase [Deinococcales bacterium]
MKPHPILEPYANLLAGRFWFDSQKGKEALILVHGNGDEADTWRHLFVPLTEHFRVIAPDLPGFGRSQTQDARVSGLVDWLFSFIEQLGLKRVHLLGSSLGGVVASLFAEKYPMYATSLCVIGGASPSLGNLQPTHAIQPLLQEGIGEAYYNGLRDTDPDVAFATLRPYYANLESLAKPEQDFLRTRVWARVFSNPQRDAFFTALRSLFTPSTRNIRLQTPCQLIWGDTDRIVPLEHAKIIQQQLPNTPLSVVKAAGHLPHQEQATTTLQYFLQNHPS